METCANVTLGMQGKDLIDMEALAKTGAVGFTDDGVPIMDAEALADAIRALTADEETYRQYGEQARKLYETCYTYDRMIDRCLDLYRRIMEKK